MMKVRDIAFGAAIGLFALSPAMAQQAMPPSGPSAAQGQQGQGMEQASNLSRSTVEQVQQHLKQQGLYRQGKVDGVWGRETAQAVESFQKSHNLQATGQPDEQTLAALGVQSGGEQASGTSGMNPAQGGTGQSVGAPPNAGQGAGANMGSGQQPSQGMAPGPNATGGQSGTNAR